MIRLRIETHGEPEYRTFRESVVVIGRSQTCNLSLPDVRGLSRFHCRLALEGGQLIVEDLGSRNRTLLNGQPVEKEEASEGDRLRVGDLELIVDSVRDDTEPTAEFVQPCLHCGQVFTAHKKICPRCSTSTEATGRSRTIGAFAFRGYRLIRKIGSGGMGIVFEAEDLTGEQDRVALKVLRPHLAKNAGYLAQFIEEIRVLTSLRAPSIVAVYGRGREADLHYLIMELVRGRSAREAMLKAGGRLTSARAVQIIWQVAKALNVAYGQAGIVHGDVKPGNFLLSDGGHVKLCDFGLARVDLKGTRPSRDQAVEAERRGTAAYAAPERFSNDGGPTIASDVYALGVSLYQLVSGQLPFRGPTVRALRDAHLSADPRPLPAGLEINPAIPILLRRMLAKRPEDRYADYPSLIEDVGLLIS